MPMTPDEFRDQYDDDFEPMTERDILAAGGWIAHDLVILCYFNGDIGICSNHEYRSVVTLGSVLPWSLESFIDAYASGPCWSMN